MMYPHSTTNASSKAKLNLNKSMLNQTMHNTAILSLTEFKSMKDRAQGYVGEEQERRIREKQELKEKGDARVAHWPNTIQAIRKNKDAARLEKFQREEEERRRIDLEEAKYQAAMKHEMLAKANKQIYDTTDRVKAFQSALLLSDVMKEREAQLEINKRRREIEILLSERYLKVEKENMKKYDEREEEKKKLEEEARRENQRVLHEQHEMFRDKHMKRFQEEKIEGEIIKIKAQEALMKQKEEEKMKRERRLEIQEDTKKANQLLQDMRYQEKLRDIEKDKEIAAFSKKKEEVIEMRKIREDLKFKEKQEARQRMIDSQIEKLKQMKDKEDEIINKQIKEAEIKAEENERIKKEKKEQLVAEIDKQITLTLDKRRVEKERQKVDDKNFQEFWITKNKELEAKENVEKTSYRERCKNLEDYHKKQINEKQKKMENDILKEFDDALRMKAAIEQEDRIFNSYAERCMTEWEGNGKNLKPLLLELKNYKKKVQ